MMLTYAHFYKEVQHLRKMSCNTPQRVYAYLQDKNYDLILVPATDFGKYLFVGYTYAQSYFPVIVKKENSICIESNTIFPFDIQLKP